MDKCRAPYFTHEEQTLILNKYQEFKSKIQAESNTASKKKECWDKIADFEFKLMVFSISLMTGSSKSDSKYNSVFCPIKSTGSSTNGDAIFQDDFG